VREWPVSEINAFIKLVKENTNLDVVLLGASQIDHSSEFQVKGEFNESIRSELTEDLRDKTTLTEAMEILSQARAVVGVDNGLLHLASCSDVPVIWGFTSVDPKHRIPVRNNVAGYNAYTVVPSAGLNCRFCQSKYYYVEHNFKNCLQVTLNSSPTIPCTTDMKAEKFMRILKTRILKR
jgi:ADP-heptose:LPS heptosyltransferase